MDTKDVVTVINAPINDVLYNRVIDYIDNFPYLQKAGVTGDVNTASRVDQSIRNVNAMNFIDNQFISAKILTKLIDFEISKYYINYSSKFPHCNVQKIKEMQGLKYEVGGKYEVHTDSYQEFHRELTCIVNLNDDYEGGDFVFYNPNGKEIIKEVKTQKGQIIFFPSNHLFPHAVTPITKGVRYSLVIWLA